MQPPGTTANTVAIVSGESGGWWGERWGDEEVEGCRDEEWG